MFCCRRFIFWPHESGVSDEYQLTDGQIESAAGVVPGMTGGCSVVAGKEIQQAVTSMSSS